ncbi:MAG: DNA gyrase subunit A [Lachnospira sp.]|nr:DNA gyrase subunit A [Lachnospira sp.]
MDEHIFDKKITDVDMDKTMRSYYIDYAMSVIASRALPDVRDGMKPVQRRILYSMIELNNTPDKPHRKCARIVGDTMGKYHPHGDSSIYDALVKLAQDFSTRYPLVDGHGNFGSVDGDGAAAMRYTEARLSRISMEMMADIGKDTVDFQPNFDETEKEPTVLPARFPNLLVNGASGIAVGMATNIPPHNLREVIAACLKIIDNNIHEDRDTSVDEIMDIIKGPDFPTGGEIIGRRGIEEAYRTGRGKITVRAVTDIEPMANGKNRIVVTEIPYMVNKARLIESIANLSKEKKIDGITALRDESDRSGMRIVIELRRDVTPTVILNQLFKHTQMQDTFGVINLALVNNEPKVLNMHDMLMYYLMHQEDVVTRRTKYDLNKAEERAHILRGLLVALDNIDRVIQIIRGSQTVVIAKEGLEKEFGLSDAQAQAIVDMRLRTLTGLEREKLENELHDLEVKIEYYKSILADKKKLLGVIRDELSLISEKYGDDRRTSISYDEAELLTEDLIPDEPTIICRTNLGYIKRMTPDNFKAQNRGGRGIRGMQTIENDYIVDLFMTTNHHMLTFFTNTGRAYKLRAFEIPEAGRTARGTAIVNLLQLQPDETIQAVIALDVRHLTEGQYLFMATRNGFVKKTPVQEFANIRKNGIQAITLREGDDLIEVKLTDSTRDIFLVTKKGMCIRFPETDVRPTGRSAQGVMGMTLEEDDAVVGMQLNTEGSQLLIVSEMGLGKRTQITRFSTQHRGGKGVKCYKIVEKSGDVVGAKMVDDTREILIVTTEGVIIQLRASDVSVLDRITSGVKLISLDDGVKVASIAKIRKKPVRENGEQDAEGFDEDDPQSEETDTEG